MDVYIPAHFAVGDLAKVAAFVEGVGAADLVTFDGTRPVATLLPVIWERTDLRDSWDSQADPQGPTGLAEQAEPGRVHGRLLGHIALANPQWSSA